MHEIEISVRPLDSRLYWTDCFTKMIFYFAYNNLVPDLNIPGFLKKQETFFELFEFFLSRDMDLYENRTRSSHRSQTVSWSLNFASCLKTFLKVTNFKSQWKKRLEKCKIISQITTSFRLIFGFYISNQSIRCRYQVQKSFLTKSKRNWENRFRVQRCSNCWALNFWTFNTPKLMKLREWIILGSNRGRTLSLVAGNV